MAIDIPIETQELTMCRAREMHRLLSLAIETPDNSHREILFREARHVLWELEGLFNIAIKDPPRTNGVQR